MAAGGADEDEQGRGGEEEASQGGGGEGEEGRGIGQREGVRRGKNLGGAPGEATKEGGLPGAGNDQEPVSDEVPQVSATCCLHFQTRCFHGSTTVRGKGRRDEVCGNAARVDREAGTPGATAQGIVVGLRILQV